MLPVTATGEHQAPIQNTVGEAIVDAIIKAAQEQRKFRVIVVIPSIPGFAGDLRDDAATGTRYVSFRPFAMGNNNENTQSNHGLPIQINS